MIDLHYWPTPNGHKITLFLEELAELGQGLAYTIKPVDIGKGAQFEPDYLKISPNNKMPAIVDHAPVDGGAPISVFESGAILLYLANKTGQFLGIAPGADAGDALRARITVNEWLFWQMGGLGPMAGQAHHFRLYAPEKIPYAIDRYTNECHRLYGVMNTRLKDNAYLAGPDYTIADMACYGWASRAERQGTDMAEFPHLKRWFDTLSARPAVQRGMAVKVDEAKSVDMKDPKVQAVLFGQRAR